MNVFKIATLGTATAVLMGTTAMADGMGWENDWQWRKEDAKSE